MKTLKRTTFFALSLLLLQGCMPDSLTKFKEEAPKKKDQAGASGSDGTVVVPTPAPTPPNCIAGVEPQCTKPGTFHLAPSEVKAALPSDGEELSVVEVNPVFQIEVDNHQQYIDYRTDDPTTTAVSEFNVIGNGMLGGNATGFLPRTEFEIFAKYNSPDYFTDAETPEVSAKVAYTFAHDLPTDSVSYPQLSGQKIILTVDDVSAFVAGNSISTFGGATGTVDYVDSVNKEIHVSISTNLTSAFSVKNHVDNLAVYFGKKGEISAVYYAFDSDDGIAVFPTGFKAAIADLFFTDDEKRSVQYSINPPLPAGLNLNQFTGEFGTSYAEQIVEGLITVTADSRTIVGVSSKFSTQLAVGEVITVNNESAVIRSISSDTELEVYTPFASSAASTRMKRRLAGSLETDGTSVVKGFGSSFNTSPRIILNSSCSYCNIYVNNVDTGLQVNSISSDIIFITNGNVTATPAINELAPAIYSISAKNILGNSTSLNIHFGILSNPTPKTISALAYTQNDNQKLKMAVADPTPFTVGGYISNSDGAVGTVLFIAGNELYIEVDGTSDFTKSFKNNDDIDNASSYFSAETSIASNVVYAFPVDEIVGPATSGLAPIIDPTQASLGDEAASLEYSITPAVDASNSHYTNINNQLYMYKHSVCIDSTANFPACNGVGDCFAPIIPVPPLENTSANCGANTWVKGGTIFGTPSSVTADILYKVKVTNTLGRELESEFEMGFKRAPKGLAYTRNVLLHVPSSSAFSIGDAITTPDGAEGTVTGIVVKGSGVINGETNLPEWAYLEVRVSKGQFKEFDDIDNHPNYFAQETYVLGGGVYNYNTKLKLADTSDFVDPNYTSFIENDNEIVVGAVVKGRVIFNDEGNNALYVQAGNDAVTENFVTNPSGDKIVDALTTQDVIELHNLNPPRVAGTPSESITSVESTNILIRPTSGAIATNSGINITSPNPAWGVGVLSRANTNTNIIYTNSFFVNVNSGYFARSSDLDDINPFLAQATTINSVGHEHSFYFYKGEEARIELNLDSGATDTVFTLDKALPTGLTFDPNDFSISGKPTDAASIEVFTVTATNPFGSVDYTFNLKVYDHLSIKVNSDANFSAASYILHREGQGHGRSPCRITKEQIATGGTKVNDMVCYLEAGETELYEKGVKMTLSFGDNMCQFISNKPMMGFVMPPGTTNPGVARVFAHAGAAKDICGAPDFSTSHLVNTPGTASGSEVDDARSQCAFIHDINSHEVNCDDGEVSITDVTWTQQAFECTNNAGVPFPEFTTAAECVRNMGSCTYAGPDCDNTNTGTVCTTYDECIAGNGANVWTYDGFHNNGGYAGEGDADPQMGHTSARSRNTGALTLLDSCLSSSLAAPNFECGGEIAACAIGQGKDIFSAQDINDGIRWNTNTMNASTLAIDIPSPRDQEHSTNVAIANYTTDTTCRNGDDYSFNAAQYADYPDGITTTNYLSGGSNSYIYTCDNGSGTPQARIFLVIRDWDLDFKVADEIDKFFLGGTLMDNAASTLGVPNNAKRDIDNIKGATPNFCVPPAAAGDFNFTNGQANTAFPGDGI